MFVLELNCGCLMPPLPPPYAVAAVHSATGDARAAGMCEKCRIFVVGDGLVMHWGCRLLAHTAIV